MESIIYISKEIKCSIYNSPNVSNTFQVPTWYNLKDGDNSWEHDKFQSKYIRKRWLYQSNVPLKQMHTKAYKGF